MTAVHSGFQFKCTTCGLTLGRRDQKHACGGGALQRVKKATGTMTWEEANEFAKFQRERGQHVVPFVKELPVAFSDQPYLPGQERKRAIPTEPHHKGKKLKGPKTEARAAPPPPAPAPRAPR